MLGERNTWKSIYLVCGYTDMRMSINGLASIVEMNYGLNAGDGSIFLFCGKRNDRIKALLYEPDGYLLMYKRLSDGRYKWPRKRSEAKELTEEEFQWLMQGLDIEQPKAIKKCPAKKVI